MKRQIQAGNSVETHTIKLDVDSCHNLSRVHKLINELLNENVSNSVIMRRALFLYRIHFMEQVYYAFNAKSKEERAEMLSAFFETERIKLKESAGK